MLYKGALTKRAPSLSYTNSMRNTQLAKSEGEVTQGGSKRHQTHPHPDLMNEGVKEISAEARP